MSKLTDLPNIGEKLASKLKMVGINNLQELSEAGSENTIIKIATLQNSGACINMLFALEGAIQGVRWHNLSEDRKQDLNTFYQLLNKS